MHTRCTMHQCNLICETMTAKCSCFILHQYWKITNTCWLIKGEHQEFNILRSLNNCNSNLELLDSEYTWGCFAGEKLWSKQHEVNECHNDPSHLINANVTYKNYKGTSRQGQLWTHQQHQLAMAPVTAHAQDLPPDPIQDPAPGTTLDPKPAHALAPAHLVQASMAR